jgi:predicted phosphodiesterase
MKLRFLGDVHGKFKQLPEPSSVPIIQLGDLGVGFVDPYELDLLAMREDFYFIRGNHDWPAVCRRHPCYLGDFGMAPERLGRFFYLSGAYSEDYLLRIPGVSWWDDEELSSYQLFAAQKMYEREKPEVVVTHEAPASIAQEIYNSFPVIGGGSLVYQPSRTAQALEALLSLHTPRLWIFGHHHVPRHIKKNGTTFICVESHMIYEADL